MKTIQANLPLYIIFVLTCSMFLFTGTGGAVYAGESQAAQDTQVDRVEVPLTDPSRPASVNAGIHMGSITVTGHSGKNIIVEASPVKTKKMKKLQEAKKKALLETLKEKGISKKETEGMYRVQDRSTGLSIEEENNVVDVKVSWHNRAIHLDIKVPYKTSLKLKGLNDGYIKVENVGGELDVNHHNGPVTLKNVSGTVMAHSMNGAVTVVFDKVNLEKPMSFSTFNGDVDVTFPKNAKFTLKMNTRQGEIYSDFKLDIKAPSKSASKGERKGGKFVVKFDNTIHGLLNGGGEEVLFKTYNGDIYIREKK